MRAADLRATHRLVTGLVERELRREDLPPATFGNLRSQELILAKTADRSVLGCTKDMAFLCEVAIAQAGGLPHCDPGELNQALHRNINSSRAYRPPGRARRTTTCAQSIKRTRTGPRARPAQLVTLRPAVQPRRHHIP